MSSLFVLALFLLLCWALDYIWSRMDAAGDLEKAMRLGDIPRVRSILVARRHLLSAEVVYAAERWLVEIG